MEDLLNLFYWVGDFARRAFSRARNGPKDDYFYWSNLLIGPAVLLAAFFLIYVIFEIAH